MRRVDYTSASMKLLSSLASAFALLFAGAGFAAPVATPHLTADLGAQTSTAAPGSTLWVGVVQKIQPGWHTYWRNPGDAGEATRLTWSLPPGWRAGPIQWPAPSRFLLGPIMSYGYQGRVLLAVPIEVPAGERPGSLAHLAARMDFLVCKDVCVPGSASLDLALPIAAGVPPLDPKWGPLIAQALAKTPKAAGIEADWRTEGGRLILSLAGHSISGGGASAWFYPFDDKLIDQGAPEAVDLGRKGLTFTLAEGSDFKGGRSPASVSGVLVLDGRGYEILARPGGPLSGASGLGPPRASAARSKLTLPLAALLAFLGGLILNLMPCVFPILSIKAAALAARAGEPRQARLEGLAFLAGTMASFLILAGVMIGFRAAGVSAGWGFQLQSPLIVGLLALVMLAAALNLSGVFEAGLGLQSLAAQARPTQGAAGGVLTGVLAVVVAAPCTAPFMGPALGCALTLPTSLTLAIFAALAAGFAAPFTLLSASPALVRALPGPGPWMEALRRLLAFPMYAAAAWLLWVFDRQTGAGDLARLLAAAICLAFAAFLWGAAQKRSAHGARAWPIGALAVAGLAGSIAFIAAGGASSPGPIPASRAEAVAPAGNLSGEPWSPQRLAELRAAGKPVLVNFTAAWCVTCQVNERLVFSSPEVLAAFRRTGAGYLIADWTDRDPAIAQALAAEGRIGVPLYLLYAPGADAPRILPQLLSPGLVAEAIRSAAVRPPGPSSAAGSEGS
ncbi:MAG: protein-disulfide reductase DsbD family protein [Caulobacteraceae bacterium]